MIDYGTKIIITGAKHINKMDLAKIIISKDDDLSIGSTFSSKSELKDMLSENYVSFMNNDEINLCLKNNVLLYIMTDNNNVSTGVTLDSFYNNDIFVMNIEEFNSIPENTLSKHDIIVIWLDTKFKDVNVNIESDIAETKYLLERLDYTNYMYFLDEDYNDVSNTIIEYINADDERKEELMQENL